MSKWQNDGKTRLDQMSIIDFRDRIMPHVICVAQRIQLKYILDLTRSVLTELLERHLIVATDPDNALDSM
jgi:hypothetical protein